MKIKYCILSCVLLFSTAFLRSSHITSQVLCNIGENKKQHWIDIRINKEDETGCTAPLSPLDAHLIPSFVKEGCIYNWRECGSFFILST